MSMADKQDCPTINPNRADSTDPVDNDYAVDDPSCSSRLSSEPNSPRDDCLKVMLFSKKARVPQRASEFAAGLDLHAAQSCVIPEWSRMTIPTDIAVQIPSGCYGRVAPRSGLAKKYFIDVAAGVIDEDYRGPLGVILVNNSAAAFTVEEGDRIAQLILERYSRCAVEVCEALDDSQRGSGGFGSTGNK